LRQLVALGDIDPWQDGRLLGLFLLFFFGVVCSGVLLALLLALLIVFFLLLFLWELFANEAVECLVELLFEISDLTETVP